MRLHKSSFNPIDISILYVFLMYKIVSDYGPVAPCYFRNLKTEKIEVAIGLSPIFLVTNPLNGLENNQ